MKKKMTQRDISKAAIVESQVARKSIVSATSKESSAQIFASVRVAKIVRSKLRVQQLMSK